MTKYTFIENYLHFASNDFPLNVFFKGYLKNASFNDTLIKQIAGCPIGGSLSVVLAGIFMAKMECDVVQPYQPQFYKRYVDDVITKRNIGIGIDNLFPNLNNYHPNISLTLEVNPKQFLDTSVDFINCETITSVYTKKNKLPVFWSSKIPKRYKRNAIKGELHRASKISSSFNVEVNRIRQKLLNQSLKIFKVLPMTMS